MTYDAGMAYAKSVNKPVLLDFTGHGCVNCRKMELAVWHDPKVRDLLMKDYVLISLYVDEKAPLPENVEVQEDGKTTTLRTSAISGATCNAISLVLTSSRSTSL